MTASTILPPKRSPEEIETWDELTAKTKKLEALLANVYGTCGESFRSQSELTQDNYLWACADLARDCRELASSLCLQEVSHG